MVAGVLHGWLQDDFVHGLRYGALTAALTLSHYGDQVVISAPELEKLLEKRVETSSADCLSRKDVIMMLESLREQVWQANVALPTEGLVTWTSGNVSGRDPETNLMVIKPSGVLFDDLTPADLVVVDMNGQVVEGDPWSIIRYSHPSVGLSSPGGCTWHRAYALQLCHSICGRE